MRKAGEILSAFFDERLSKEGQTYSALFNSWHQIAGDQVAAHSRIIELERTILFVEADHPGWIMILQSREKELLERVRRFFPELLINGISFRLSKTGNPIPSQNKRSLSGKLTSEDSTDKEGAALEDQEPEPIKAAYERIQDPQFKELLMKLERSIKSKHT